MFLEAQRLQSTQLLAVSCLTYQTPDNHVFVKLDFSNAFNSVRRDTILTTVEDKMPELYRFVQDSLDCNLKLIYGDNAIISVEGSQQGDSLSGLEFCESVQPILLER